MHHAAKIVDLARKPDVIKQELATMPEAVRAASRPRYPWGTCITLDDETLDALGMEGEMPPAGAEVHGCFVGIVKCSRPDTERVGEDGKVVKEGASVEIEIHQLGFAAEEDADRAEEASEQKRKTWYGNADLDKGTA